MGRKVKLIKSIIILVILFGARCYVSAEEGKTGEIKTEEKNSYKREDAG